MTAELVSIIIPTYNRGNIIVETVRSALGQTYKDVEVLVVDDGSTDDTKERIEAVGDSRVFYYRLQHFGYPAPARNYGIKRASGTYIAFLDSDDVWFPRKLETQIRFLQQNPNIVAIASNFVLFQGDRRPVLKLKVDRIVSFKDILNQNLIVNSSVVLRKDVTNAVGLLNESATFKSVEDCDFWLRILNWQNSSICILSQPLVQYRIHETNISKQQQAFAPLMEIKRLLQVYKQYVRDQREDIENVITSKLDFARYYLRSKRVESRPFEFLRTFNDPILKPFYKIRLLLSLFKGIKRAIS
jgi:glycosyltransferase involved in cell wall biosynthesis